MPRVCFQMRTARHVYCLVWRGWPGSEELRCAGGWGVVALAWVVICSVARLVPGQKEMGVQWRRPSSHLHTLWFQSGVAGLKAVRGAPGSGWASFLLQESHPRKEMGVGQAAEIVRVDSSLPGIVFHSLSLSPVLELGMASGQRCPTSGKHKSLPLTPHSLCVGQGVLRYPVDCASILVWSVLEGHER